MRPQTSHRIAKTVTELFAPAVLASLLLILTAVDVGVSGILPALVALCFVTALPFGVIYSAVKFGRLTDHHVSVRKHRAPVLLGTLLSILVGVVVLVLINAPAQLLLVVLCVLLGLLLVMAANLAWKLSAHAAVALFFSMVCVALYGPFAVTTAVIPASVGWSRIALNAHTRTQVVAGYIVGGVVGLAYVVGKMQLTTS